MTPRTTSTPFSKPKSLYVFPMPMFYSPTEPLFEFPYVCDKSTLIMLRSDWIEVAV